MTLPLPVRVFCLHQTARHGARPGAGGEGAPAAPGAHLDVLPAGPRLSLQSFHQHRCGQKALGPLLPDLLLLFPTLLSLFISVSSAPLAKALW